MKIFKIILVSLLAIVVLAVGVFLLYMNTNQYSATQDAINLYNESNVEFIDNGNDSYYHYVSEGENTTNTGFIFYTGGKVDEDAYAYIGHDLASNNYDVFMPEFRWNIAMVNINIANQIIEENSDIENWYIIGHSLGGTAASVYATENANKIDGMIFLASYPADNAYAATNIPTLAITGSEDQVLTWENYKPEIFPANTTFVTIEGGNHGGFGDYGQQEGDGQATITPEEQHKQVIDEILKFVQ